MSENKQYQLQRTTQKDKVETANRVWRIFREQSNRCDILADAFVTNGQVQKVSSVNGELVLTVGIRMKVSYKKLFKLLIDLDMNHKDLAREADISIATITKMRKEEGAINTAVWDKICSALNCTIDDILEIVPSN